MSIRKAYSDIVEWDNLVHDDAQLRIVERLQQLQSELESAPVGLQKILSAIGLSGKPSNPKGIYMWGGVGRGKTFLMDLFFESLNVPGKRRIHFHRMMREVHERLHSLRGVEDPLAQVATGIAHDTRVLCFDEFFVSDIADAMVLGRLLEALFTRGVTLVATSNVPPDGLYPNGLQRERFLPAIDVLQRYTNVVEMDSGTDYRLRVMEKAGTYITPAGPEATERLGQIFSDLASGTIVDGRILDILGRDIRTIRCAKGIAWFDFAAICDGPRSQNDYIEIARWYQTVLITDIPVMHAQREDQARRFISLVDEFYDRRVNLIVSAAAQIDALYSGTRLQFEFERTASRLTEMQSSDYLHEPHLA